MTISIPSSLVFNGSSVVDPAFFLSDLVKNCKATRITEGFEIQEGTKVFKYHGKDFTPATYNENYEEYKVGDIVLKNCKLYRISGKKGNHSYTQYIPYEPEEYGSWDSDIKFDTWTHRYVRFKNNTKNGICAGYLGYYKERHYYFYKDYNPCTRVSTCGHKFTAKDALCYGCGVNAYKSTCLDTATATRFTESKDIKADIGEWGGEAESGKAGCSSYTRCGGSTIKVGHKLPTLNLKSIIIRGGYIYARTHLSDTQAPPKFHEIDHAGTIKYTLVEVKTPTDIKGFEYERNVYALSVIDDKDYTVVADTPPTRKHTWSFYNTEQFDTIAFANVIADGVSIKVTDENGTELININRVPIENELSNSRFEVGVTRVLYSPLVNDELTKVTDESLISIEVEGNSIQLGDILVGDSLDYGFTDLKFSNDLEDYSPYEKDDLGNIYYKRGVVVRTFSGTIDFETTKYDEMVRQMEFVAGREVIINGSDSLDNTPPNSISIFQSTMMVGRISNFKVETVVNDGEISHGTATFDIEERV